MAKTGHMAVWQPVSWFVTALQYKLFDGADEAAFSRGMHVANIVLHGIASMLCFLVLQRLLAIGTPADTRRSPNAIACASLIGTLLFAVHPLRVELVAWATAQPYILASIGCLASVWSYLEARETGRFRWLVFSWLAFALAVMSKSAAMPLFAVVVVLDWYPLRRLGRPKNWFGSPRIWFEKVPFVLIAVAVSLAAVLTKQEGGSTMWLQAHGVAARSAQACYGLVFYTWKTLAPVGLSPLYEIRLPLDYTAARYVICGLIVLAATVGLVFYRRRVPAIATCVIVYTILVFPVLGFVQSGNQEVADRYSYLPCVAWSALLAAGVLKLWNRGLWFRMAAGGLTVLVTLQLAVLTREQCGVWKNTAALWTRAWMLQPDSSLAQNSYAFSVLMRQGRFEEAVPHLRRAIEIKGDNDKAHYNLHTALSRLNRNDELFEAYQHTLRVFARYERSAEVRASAHFRLGNMLYLRKEFDAAIKHFRDALALRPNHASTHGTLSAALERKNDREGAKRHASRALELDPSLIPPRRVLARALRSEGRLEDAIAQLREALRHDPDNARTKRELGRMTQSP